MPKTGTKSLCTALRILGLNVYDYEEQCYYIGDQLYEAITTGYSKEQYRKMLEGVDATTDFPISLVWEFIADAFPEAKIIHMERESEDAWFKSFMNQMEVARKNILIRLILFLSPSGSRLQRLMNASTRAGFGFLPSSPITRQPVNEQLTRMKYRQHNNHVKSSVPKERLLVYKLGDGWKPLCEFLNLPVPEEPYPHRNKGGVIVDELLEDSLLFKKIKSETYFILFVLFAFIVVFFSYFFNSIAS